MSYRGPVHQSSRARILCVLVHRPSHPCCFKASPNPAIRQTWALYSLAQPAVSWRIKQSGRLPPPQSPCETSSALRTIYHLLLNRQKQFLLPAITDSPAPFFAVSLCARP